MTPAFDHRAAAPLGGSRSPGDRRAGLTLLETLTVLGVIGVMTAIAVPRLGAAASRQAVRGAARDVSLLLAAAREIAATSLDGTAVTFDAAAGVVRLVVGGDTVRSADLAAVHGVRLTSSRDSLAYDWRGIGVGAANLTIVVSRSPAAETLYVSRLGRVRGGRW